MNRSSRNSYVAEITAIAMYACALAVVMVFHEPWFDEAQAWFIARDASLRDLLETITHYEGHPPLWFLMLIPAAKLGIPFEIGIKSTNFIFAVAAMAILVFKAPFRRVVRCALPFTYFFFYQYGVISRTYSLMMLGFVFAAQFYRTRNERPFRFTTALAILCGASAYGIVLSLGIALVWLWETLMDRRKNENIIPLRKDSRLIALFALFAVNIFLVWSVIPKSDTCAIRLIRSDSFSSRMLYMLFMAPADVLFSQSFRYGEIDISMNLQCACSLFLGILFQFAVCTILKLKGKAALYIIPYFFLALFSSVMYFTTHHLGIVATYILFLSWCAADDRKIETKIPDWIKKMNVSQNDKRAIRLFGFALACVAIGISLYWSVSASVHDIMYNYGTGRDSASLIKNEKLDQCDILAAWRVYSVDSLVYIDYNVFEGIPALAYFDSNIFMNFNGGQKNKCYLTHQIDPDGYFMKGLSWKDYPGVLFGMVDLMEIYGTRIMLKDYELVAVVPGNMIWKDRLYSNFQLIYIRKDLLPEHPDLINDKTKARYGSRTHTSCRPTHMGAWIGAERSTCLELSNNLILFN